MERTPACGQIRKCAVAQLAGLGHHPAALLFGGVEQLDGVVVGAAGQRFGLRLSAARELGSILFGGVTDRLALGVGQRDLVLEHVLGFAEELGRPLLRRRDDVLGRIVGGPEDLGSLDADCSGERRFVELGVLRPTLGFDDADAKHRLALDQVAELAGHLREKLPHRLAVHTATRGREGLARDLVRAQRRA